MKLFRYSKYLLLPWLLVNAFAYAQVTFSTTTGDGICANNAAMVTYDVAINYRTDACKALGETASARIAGGGSMANYLSGCKVTAVNQEKQAVTLCEKITFRVTAGDKTCASDSRLATASEATLFHKEACSAFGSNQWYIARLAGDAAMNGPGYSCTVTHDAPTNLGHSLCVVKN